MKMLCQRLYRNGVTVVFLNIVVYIAYKSAVALFKRHKPHFFYQHIKKRSYTVKHNSAVGLLPYAVADNFNHSFKHTAAVFIVPQHGTLGLKALKQRGAVGQLIGRNYADNVFYVL